MSLRNRLQRIEREAERRGEVIEPLVTLGAGQRHELECPLRLLPTVAQWRGREPFSSTTPMVLKAWNRQRHDRKAEAEATMAIFN